LNNIIIELRSEGINNIQIVGINGIEYVNKPLSGMIDGTILPWVQDNTDQQAWQEWDAYIRDFFILNDKGQIVEVINLTPFNPDPSVNEGENYRIIKDLLLSGSKL
tara:strand:- start:1981 stop:2298 length:318 start_codon:yes stop_codon:yes gene_type:complete